jgi:hypothetical protein
MTVFTKLLHTHICDGNSGKMKEKKNLLNKITWLQQRTVKRLWGFASAYSQEFALTLRTGYSKQSKEEAHN